MLDANIKTQLAAYLQKLQRPIELLASLDSRRIRPRDAGPAAGNCRAVRAGEPPGRRQRGPQTLVRGRPGWRRSTHQLCWYPDGARIHVAGSSPAACRGSSAEGRRQCDRGNSRHSRQIPFRNLHFAFLPQLPGRRAGAEPDGRQQPRHQPPDDRRSTVPGRGQRAPDHGCADGLSQRRAVRPGPHGPGGDRRQDRFRRGAARRRENQRSRALRRTHRRWRPGWRRGGDLRRTQRHSHRAWSASASVARSSIPWLSRTSSR
jgi:hypothetical protein